MDWTFVISKATTMKLTEPNNEYMDIIGRREDVNRTTTERARTFAQRRNGKMSHDGVTRKTIKPEAIICL